MFKCLLRSSYTCNITRNIGVSACSNAREKQKDVARSFTEAFHYILRRTRMDIDRKMKELEELFTKTGTELGEIVKKNEEFVAEELRKVRGVVQNTVEVCSKGQMDRLDAVKDTYANRIKICNDKAASGLRAVKTKYELEVQTAENLRTAMKQILKECMDTNEFVKCVASRTKEAAQRRKEIADGLNGAVKNAEASATQQLKEATKCHAEAQMEALRSLQQILKDTTDCISKTR
ncbi:uncharacterized protein LOC143208054 [Lasioglossum baleicum]|uniref:uncharacterized protein LOC143208054 n=1 Tax=Lasioglossum baleicum TaxID=434251 RepID=UPI003FCEDAF5